MDYRAHYDRLIARARSRTLDGYTEIHHILPKSMGGDDNMTNLVKLTPEEHLVAHLLLYKIHTNSQTLYAAIRMHNRVKNNKQYGYLRRQFSNFMQQRMSGLGNPMYGKTQTAETRLKISNANKGRIFSEETRKIWSEKRRGKSPGNKGKKHTPDALSKIKAASLGENNPMYGRKHSDETKQKIGIKSVGRKPRLGVKLSEETKEKCKNAALKRTKKECPHCGRMVVPSNYARWHGDACKMKVDHDD